MGNLAENKMMANLKKKWQEKNRHNQRVCLLNSSQLNIHELSARNFIGTQATCADIYSFRGTVFKDTDFSQIGLPNAACVAIGMTNRVAADRFFLAYITLFCHLRISFAVELISDKYYNTIII